MGAQSSGSSIIASYATGNADGGAGNDRVGGLVGWQGNDSSIIGSYATGVADGGAGNDHVGGLLGLQSGGSSTESYSFVGVVSNENTLGPSSGTAYPTGVTMAEDLTAANAGTQWVSANSPWDFGTVSQTPALRYITGATLSGTTVTYQCDASLLPAGVSCGDLLDGQGR